MSIDGSQSDQALASLNHAKQTVEIQLQMLANMVEWSEMLARDLADREIGTALIHVMDSIGDKANKAQDKASAYISELDELAGLISSTFSQ